MSWISMRLEVQRPRFRLVSEKAHGQQFEQLVHSFRQRTRDN